MHEALLVFDNQDLRSHAVARMQERCHKDWLTWQVLPSLYLPASAVDNGTATTGTNGAVQFKYRLWIKDPVGIYQVTADANLNNAAFGHAATSFSVQ